MKKMHIRNKKILIYSSLGIMGVLSLGASIAMLMSNSHESQKIKEFAKELEIDFITDDRKNKSIFLSSDLKVNNLFLKYKNDVMNFALDILLFQNYEIKLDEEQGFFPNDLKGEIEIILLISNKNDPKIKVKTIKKIIGFKNFDLKLLNKSVNISKKDNVDYFKMKNDINSLKTNDVKKIDVLKKYFNIEKNISKTYITDIEVIYETPEFKNVSIFLNLNKNIIETENFEIKNKRYMGKKQHFSFNLNNEIKKSATKFEIQKFDFNNNELSNASNSTNLILSDKFDKITNIFLNKFSRLKDKLPSEVYENELTKENLSLATNSGVHNIPNSYDLTYGFPTTKFLDDFKGTMDIMTTLKKGSISFSKIFRISGFKTLDEFLSDELKKVSSLSIKNDINSKIVLPSFLTNKELADINIEPRKKDLTIYTAPSDYSIKYVFDEEKEAKDYTGTAKVNMIISKNEISKSKTFVTSGFKNKLDLITISNLGLEISSTTLKSSTLPTSLVDNEGDVISSKLKPSILDEEKIDFSKYNIFYEKFWLNDIEGKAGLNITLQLKENNQISKTLNNVVLNNLKSFSITENLNNVKLKESKKETTIEDILEQILAENDDKIKLNVFKEYFDFEIKSDLQIEKFISITGKKENSTIGTISYTLSKKGISKGNPINKMKTDKVISAPIILDISNFSDKKVLLENEFKKISTIEISGDVLKNKLPSQVNLKDLNLENIIVKKVDGQVYIPKKGYSIAFKESDSKFKDDYTGKIIVKIELIKNGISISKDLELSELQTKLGLISNSNINLNINSNISKSTTLISDLIKTNKFVKKTELDIEIKDVEKFTKEDFKFYTINYEKSWINDVEGKAAFNVTLTLNKNKGFKKTFNNIEVLGFKKFDISEVLTEVKLKSSKKEMTSENFAKLIYESTNKLETFKNYFDYKIPVGFELKTIESFSEKETSPTTGILIYRLSKNGIFQGTKYNKNFISEVISTPKTLNILEFIDPNFLLQQELKKITSISIKENLKNKLPSEFSELDLNQDSLVPNTLNKVYIPMNGYKLSYQISKTPVKNDRKGTMKIKVVISKNNLEQSKEMLIVGLKSKSIIEEELEKIKFIEIREKFINQLNLKYPTELNDENLTSETLIAKKEDGSEYIPPIKYSLIFFISNSKDSDDDKGIAVIDYKIILNNNENEQGFFKKQAVSGFKKKIDSINEDDININIINPSINYASSYVSDKNIEKFDRNKFETSILGFDSEIDKYSLEYERYWVNDFEGKLSLVLKIILNSDPKIFRKFTRKFQFTNLKKYTIEGSTEKIIATLNGTYKDKIFYKSAENHIGKGYNDDDKFRIIKAYFDFNIEELPKDSIIASVTFEGSGWLLDDFVFLTFLIKKANVDNGSDENTSEKKDALSEYKKIKIHGFNHM